MKSTAPTPAAVNSPPILLSGAWTGCDGSSSNKTDALKRAAYASSEQASFLVLDGIDAEESTNNNLSARSNSAVPESSPTAGMSPPGTPSPSSGENSSISTADSKMDLIYERQTRVHQVAKAQVCHGPRCVVHFFVSLEEGCVCEVF